MTERERLERIANRCDIRADTNRRWHAGEGCSVCRPDECPASWDLCPACFDLAAQACREKAQREGK